MKKTMLICTLMLLCVLLCACEDTKPVETTAAVETIVPVTPSETNDLGDNYIIENGVLLAYTGNETGITIPDSVTEIADSAFKNAPQITSICLGKNVQTISPKALTFLVNLKEVKIPGENTYFTATDTLLGATDGSIFFMIAPKASYPGFENSVSALGLLAERMQLPEGQKSMFVFYDMFLKIEIYGDIVEWGYNDKPAAEIYNRSINFLGRNAGSNTSYQFVMAEGAYAFTTDNDFYFISENTCYTCPAEFGYKAQYPSNDIVLQIWQRDDGKIGYTRTARKHMRWQVLGQILLYTVSPDEFCYETGYVTLGEESLIFTPEEIYTVAEVYDLEKEFETAVSVNKLHFSSLEDLFASNAKQYAACICDRSTNEYVYAFDENLDIYHTDFFIEGSRLVSYTGEDSVVIIPSGVRKIAKNAFTGIPDKTKIKTIYVHEAVTVEEGAFADLSPQVEIIKTSQYSKNAIVLY